MKTGNHCACVFDGDRLVRLCWAHTLQERRMAVLGERPATAHPQPYSRSRQGGVRPPSLEGGVGRVSLSGPHRSTDQKHSTHAAPLRTARG